MEVVIHSTLAAKCLKVPGLKLWYILRAMDMNGSGKVTIDREYIKGILGVSNSTFYRYLNNSSLFRNWVSNQNEITVYLTSLPKVCYALGVSSLGAIGFGNALDDLVEQAVGIQAQSLQAQSFYLGNLANKVSSTSNFEYDNKCNKFKSSYNPHTSKYPIVNPVNCFFDNQGNPLSPSVISSGVNDKGYMPIATAHRHDCPAGVRLAYVKYDKQDGSERIYEYLEANSYVMPWGGSQRGIAKRLNISLSTVRRSLVNHSKVRLAYKTSWHEYQRHKFEASENFGRPLEEGYIVSSNSRDVFKWGTYIYFPMYTLTTGKFLRKKVNRYRSICIV